MRDGDWEGEGSPTMMGLCRWKCTMQATSDLVAFWNRACRMFLQSSVHILLTLVTGLSAPPTGYPAHVSTSQEAWPEPGLQPYLLQLASVQCWYVLQEACFWHRPWSILPSTATVCEPHRMVRSLSFQDLGDVRTGT